MEEMLQRVRRVDGGGQLGLDSAPADGDSDRELEIETAGLHGNSLVCVGGCVQATPRERPLWLKTKGARD